MKKEIYLVPYAHLDTQWRWEYPTTINKYLKRTIDENVERYDRYPQHQFNFTGALRYQLMKEYFPVRFESVKEYISQGRWHLAGTCLDETDTLIPSVESNIRNILYGHRWQLDEFGVSSRDYMIPDCFGFPANLPTILSHCGIIGFSTQKLTWGSAVGIPFEIGMWQGPDGSEVASAFNPCAYSDRMRKPIYRNPSRRKRLEKLGKKNGVWKSFQYYGVGDIGGAPKEGSIKRAIKSIRHYENRGGEMTVRQGAADRFFEELTGDEKQKLDRYRGDLLLTKHSAGSISSAAIMKRWNRKNEMLAYAAEAACLTAMIEAGMPYPTEKIESAWHRIIASQMHDIIPGTSTPNAYVYSQNDELLALNTWTSLLADAAQMIAPTVEGDGNILLYNPTGESRKDLVAVTLPDWDSSMGLQAQVTDAEGAVLPAQIFSPSEGSYEALFIPELKPFSWTRYSINAGDANTDKGVRLYLENGSFILENEVLRVRITSKGRIESIYNSMLDRELLKKPLAYEFQREKPRMFPAWNMDWKDRKKPPFERIEEGSGVKVIEEGPLRCSLEITSRYGLSEFVKKVSLSKSSDILEFTERITWKESGCSVKLALNGNIEKPQASYNWETSRIERGINNKTAYEVPSRYWADISGKDFGISILEDSKYGYDRPSEDSLRLTLLYTPSVQKFGLFYDQKSQDWGSHTIRYALFAHGGQSLVDTDVLAGRLNQSIRAFHLSNENRNSKGKQLALLEASTEQIAILALKKAEDSNSLLIRLRERESKAQSGHITFNRAIEKAVEVNGLEECIGSVETSGRQLAVNIPANGIASYIVTLADCHDISEDKQDSIILDYDTRLIGKNGETDCSQIVFPAEMTPRQICRAGFKYQLAVDDEKNAQQCRGQNLVIPEGYNSLSILVASNTGTQAEFSWLDNDDKDPEQHYIPGMTEFIGQWDTRQWKKTPGHEQKAKRDYFWFNECTGVTEGYVHRNRMEWYSTHTHRNGEDQAYKFGCLYTVDLEIPKGAPELKLPENENLYVLAMTASCPKVKVQSSQSLVDEFDF